MTRKTTQLDWIAAARALPERPYSWKGRLSSVLADGDEARRLVELRWLPERDGKGRALVPGFSQALVPATLADEIGTLLEAIRRAQMDARYEPPKKVSPIARARKVCTELRMAIEQLVRCGAIPRAAVPPIGIGARTADALALTLDTYFDLARRHRASLAQLGSFDGTFIDEAATLAEQLRELPPRGRHLPPKVRAAVALRNRLVWLLEARVRLVHATARYIFRDHPALLSQARGADERSRRVRARATPARRLAPAQLSAADVVPPPGSPPSPRARLARRAHRRARYRDCRCAISPTATAR